MPPPPSRNRPAPRGRTDDRRRRTVVRSLLAWFASQARDLPWRRTRNPYAIWISEIMLQQTQVATVIPYWQRWMRELPDVNALADAPVERVLKLWEGLGYYSRARHLHTAARSLVHSANGELPTTASGWMALPGVGRYTAGAISSIAFDQAEPILDGNVIRVLCRLEAIAADPAAPAARARLWSLAAQLVGVADRERPRIARPCGAFNESLMELGATVCTPGIPECARCPLATVCKARARGLAHRLPAARSRPQTTRRLRRIFVIEKAGRFQLRQRGAAGGRAGLWEFPGTEEAGAADSLLDRIAPGAVLHSAAPWLIFEHSITRYRYRLEVYRARVDGRNSPREPRLPSILTGSFGGTSAASPLVHVPSPGEAASYHSALRTTGPSPETNEFMARKQAQKEQGPSRGSGPLAKSAGRWVSRAALRALPLSAAHRRIAEALQGTDPSCGSAAVAVRRSSAVGLRHSPARLRGSATPRPRDA